MKGRIKKSFEFSPHSKNPKEPSKLQRPAKSLSPPSPIFIYSLCQTPFIFMTVFSLWHCLFLAMLFITEPLVSLKKKRTGIRPRKAMSCVQGKYSVNSSPTPGGLEKLKMESGYVGKGDIAGHRRSTGQRYSGRLPKPEQPTRKYNDGCAGNGEERKLSDTGQNDIV